MEDYSSTWLTNRRRPAKMRASLGHRPRFEAPVDCSIIIRSLNEADRLRLALTALVQQTEISQVVVVDDGSTDHTRAVVAEFEARLPLKAIHHERPKGRSPASNAGAAVADGDILVFLDGDVLLAPQAVAEHLAIHRRESGAMVRGAQYHLRGTRFLQDPSTGSAMPGAEDKIATTTPAELERMKVTPTQVCDDFESIARRANASIYPGAGPAQLYALEVDALVNHPDCPVLWAAASGHNFSVPRAAFEAVGGFVLDIDQNEHREIALRLATAGLAMRFADKAASYHLTHRSGWRDPLHDTAWEHGFYRRHPLLAVKLLSVFWAGLNRPCPVPETARIANLQELAEAASGARGLDYDAVRRGIPGLSDLSEIR